jgi:diacylglycerol kinase (ATP)
MIARLRKHQDSFQYAFEGLLWAVRTQPNFRIHLLLSAGALGLGFFLGITRLEMLIIVFTILLGLMTEMINTAIESVTDLVTREWRTEAKIAKDVSAGMMVLVAFGALIVAIAIFGPYLAALWSV